MAHGAVVDGRVHTVSCTHSRCFLSPADPSSVPAAPQIHLCKADLRRFAPHLRFSADEDDVAWAASAGAVRHAAASALRETGEQRPGPPPSARELRAAAAPAALPPLPMHKRLGLGELGRRRALRDAVGAHGPGADATVSRINVSAPGASPIGESFGGLVVSDVQHEHDTDHFRAEPTLPGVSEGFSWPEAFDVGTTDGWASLRALLVDVFEAMTAAGGSSAATSVLRDCAAHMLGASWGDSVDLRFVAEASRIAAKMCGASHARHVPFTRTLDRIAATLLSELRASRPVPGCDEVLAALDATAPPAVSCASRSAAAALAAIRSAFPGDSQGPSRPATVADADVAGVIAAVLRSLAALRRGGGEGGAIRDATVVRRALEEAAPDLASAAERCVGLAGASTDLAQACDAAVNQARAAAERAGRASLEAVSAAEGWLEALGTVAGAPGGVDEEARAREDARRAAEEVGRVEELIEGTMDVSMAAFESRVRGRGEVRLRSAEGGSIR